MARTRATARKSNAYSGDEPKHNFAGNPHNRELLEKYIARNCMVMMKSSLQNVVNEDRIDIQTKFAPYRDCLKLARLWILKDMLKNNNHSCDENISPLLLANLPLEVKIEIISFIPTYSKVNEGNSYSEKRGALRKSLLVQDPYYFTYIKHRLVSQSVRNHLEQLIFQRMSKETLNLSVFLTSLTPSLHLYRIKVIQFLLTEQNKYLSEKSTEYKFFNLPPPEKQLPLRDPVFPEMKAANEELETDENNMLDDDNDLTLMSLDELELMENNLVEDLSKKSISKPFKSPFQKEQPGPITWKSLEYTQRSSRKEIHSALAYYEPYQNFYDKDNDLPDDDDGMEDFFKEDEDEKNYNTLNEYVKSVKVSFTDMTSPQSLSETISKLKKLDRLEMEIYEIYEGNRNMLFFTNLLSHELLEGLDSVTVTYFEKLTMTLNHFSMLGKLPNVKNVFLKAILDTNTVDMLFVQYASHNIYLNSVKVQEVESENNLYISSITISDIMNANNPWYCTKALIGALGSTKKVYSVESQREIADFVLKRYSPVLLHIDSVIESFINNPVSLAIVQYIIYLTNTYHEGKFFLSIPQPFKEKTYAQLIHSGWDISNQITQIFPSLGPDFGQLLLDHWSQLLKQNLCKLDIPSLRHQLSLIINTNRNCRLLAFLCEHCSNEDKVELFKNFKYGFFADQYLETNLVNIMCDGLEGAAFSYILKYLDPSYLLEKSLKVKSTKICSSTSLQYAIENQKIGNDSIAALIEMQPLLIHIADNEGITPLHQLCTHSSRWSLIPLLLKYNVDTQAVDRNGETPLHYLQRNFPFHKFIFPYLHELSP